MTEAKNKEVEAIQKKETSTGKTYWLITIEGDYYSAWKIPEGLQAGDIINFSWHFKGDFRNVTAIEMIKKVMLVTPESTEQPQSQEKSEEDQPKIQPKEDVQVKIASEISDEDNEIRKGVGIMMKCEEAIDEMLKGKKVSEEHKIILINSLFHYVTRPRPKFELKEEY